MYAQRPFRLLAMAALLPCATVSARALECPVPHPEATGSALRETPVQIANYSAILAKGDTGNAVGVIIAELRRKHPDATTAEIVNFMVAAYCSALTEQGYGGQVAASKIREFSALVEARLLKPEKNPADAVGQTD